MEFKDDNSYIYLCKSDYSSTISDDRLIEKQDAIYESMDDLVEEWLDVYDVTDTNVTSFLDRVALERYYSGKKDDHELNIDFYFVKCDDIKSMVGMIFLTNKEYMDEYSTIYDEVLSSARIDDGTFSVSNEDKDSDSDTDATGVDPDLKEFLDSYEEFMDEYVEFMNDYLKNPGNVLSMLDDYTKMIEDLEEFEKKADEYDPDNMSAADSAYYLEVMTRIEKKMLNVLN